MIKQNSKFALCNIYYAIITRLDAFVVIRKKNIYLCRDADIYSFLRDSKGNIWHTLCVQSVECYTFADGAGVKMYCSPYLSNTF